MVFTRTSRTSRPLASMMMTRMRRTAIRIMAKKRTTTITRVSQLWDLIESWGFRDNKNIFQYWKEVLVQCSSAYSAPPPREPPKRVI